MINGVFKVQVLIRVQSLHLLGVFCLLMDIKSDALREAYLQCSNTIQNMEKELRSACHAPDTKVDSVFKCAFLHTSGKSSSLRLCTLGTMSEGLVNGNWSGSHPTLGWRWAGHLCLLLEFVPFMCLMLLVAGILHEVDLELVEILAGLNKEPDFPLLYNGIKPPNNTMFQPH
ncbi:GB1/RHD3-type G domain-containing protein [Forsythia ovata]|uniref:GB1/RHD3-type G domain-containing protein n=1 Tax=Forsythia ovata TaxID=205694 RepID=A0ABD1WMV8_9LAMI